MKKLCIALIAAYGLLSAFLIYRWTGSVTASVTLAGVFVLAMAVLQAGRE